MSILVMSFIKNVNPIHILVTEDNFDELHGRPRWLNWMRFRLVIRRVRVRPPPGRQHSFVEIYLEIFSTVIYYLQLIQEGQLSVFGERM